MTHLGNRLLRGKPIYLDRRMQLGFSLLVSILSFPALPLLFRLPFHCRSILSILPSPPRGCHPNSCSTSLRSHCHPLHRVPYLLLVICCSWLGKSKEQDCRKGRGEKRVMLGSSKLQSLPKIKIFSWLVNFHLSLIEFCSVLIEEIAINFSGLSSICGQQVSFEFWC